MLPKYHLLFALIFALILFYLFPQITWLGFAIILFSSFLIDVDHYLFYVWKEKDISLKNAFKWFHFRLIEIRLLPRHQRKKKAKQRKEIPCIFHGIEAIIILILLSFFSKIFLYILIGFIFHQLLDFIYIVWGGFPLAHIGSQIYNIINYLKK